MGRDLGPPGKIVSIRLAKIVLVYVCAVPCPPSLHRAQLGRSRAPIGTHSIAGSRLLESKAYFSYFLRWRGAHAPTATAKTPRASRSAGIARAPRLRRKCEKASLDASHLPTAFGRSPILATSHLPGIIGKKSCRVGSGEWGRTWKRGKGGGGVPSSNQLPVVLVSSENRLGLAR